METKPRFETAILWNKIQVFDDRIVYTEGILKKQQTINAKAIASINAGIPAVGQIIIETTGGANYKLLLKPKDKQALLEAIREVSEK